MQFVQKMMFSMVNSCEKTTQLIEKKAIQPLTFSEKLKMKLHFSMCEACKVFENQSIIIEKAIAQWFENNQNQTLSDEVKATIIQKVTTS